MKTTIFMLLLAGGLALPAAAANSDSSPSASTTLRQNTKHPFFEFWKSKTAPSTKIERYGSISSRPWSQIAGRPAPALFIDQRVYEPGAAMFLARSKWP